MRSIFSTGLLALALLTSQNLMAATTTPPTPLPKSLVNNQANFNDAQVKGIQNIVHDYLVKNPQVLVEASQAYQDQEFAKAKTKTQQAVLKNAKPLFNSLSSPTVGNKEGDVSVVEFLDYQCTHCREMSMVIDSLIKSDNKVRIVVKQLPIFGGSSKYAAQASIAAIKQGQDKFLAFHRALLEMPLPLTDEKVNETAKKVGLNVQQLQTDMKNKEIENQLNDNFKLAQDLGLLGTPAFFIGNRIGTHVEYLPGVVTTDSVKQAIKQVRK